MVPPGADWRRASFPPPARSFGGHSCRAQFLLELHHLLLYNELRKADDNSPGASSGVAQHFPRKRYAMASEIIVNAGREETRVALLENSLVTTSSSTGAGTAASPQHLQGRS